MEQRSVWSYDARLKEERSLLLRPPMTDVMAVVAPGLPKFELTPRPYAGGYGSLGADLPNPQPESAPLGAGE